MILHRFNIICLDADTILVLLYIDFSRHVWDNSIVKNSNKFQEKD